MYVRNTNSNRSMKARRESSLSARMRRETRGMYRRGNNVRRAEVNTCHAVNARQIYGLKGIAEGAGGRATC